ncbi:MAG: hypothetical protein HY000_02130 [Planctomycetes bacterium]|nr:hypothetical protein [Planctomycetota bacterium]
MDTAHVITAIRALKPDAIRQRLAEIAAERRALLTLLRAAQHASRGRDRRQQQEAAR